MNIPVGIRLRGVLTAASLDCCRGLALPDLAIDALQEGLDSAALIELAGDYPGVGVGAASRIALFRTAMDELGIDSTLDEGLTALTQMEETDAAEGRWDANIDTPNVVRIVAAQASINPDLVNDSLVEAWSDLVIAIARHIAHDVMQGRSVLAACDEVGGLITDHDVTASPLWVEMRPDAKDLVLFSELWGLYQGIDIPEVKSRSLRDMQMNFALLTRGLPVKDTGPWTDLPIH